MAFFKALPHAPIPTTDICSWLFDQTPPYSPHKPVLIDASNPSNSISHTQARVFIRKYIAGLRAHGVRRGDCVNIHAFNDVQYVMLALAIMGVGGCFAGSNPAYTKGELEHHLRTTDTRFVVCEPELLGPMTSAMEAVGLDTAKIICFHPLASQTCPEGMTSYLSLLEHGEEDWVRFTSDHESKTATAARFTSSGTTGLPKACVNTHFNLIAQHELNYSPAYWKKPYEVKHLWPLPLFHAAVGPRAFTTSFKCGEDAYLMRRFELEAYVRGIERWGITELYMVPPIAVAVIMSPLVQSGEVSLKSVRAGAVGAAPLTKETQARLREYLGEGARFCQVWGMTEGNCIVASFEYPEDDDSGSVGYLRPGLEGKLVDDEGSDVSGYGVEGEMCVRGPLVIPGYFNVDGTLNRKDWDEAGFYHSGDVMRCDEKTKKWYIVDRKKELIKVRGFQVAPPEVEGVILDMKGVVDCAVIGVRDVDGEGEVPRAYVIRRSGHQPEVSESAVKKWVKERLASFKRLEGGVKFVDTIPKTASGKILKRVLREEAKKERKDSAARL